MKIERDMMLSGQLPNQQQYGKSEGAESFASILSSTQTKNAEEKVAKNENSLGLSDEEYERCFCTAFYFDAEHIVYFPPKDASEEEQRIWYETVKDMSQADLHLYMANLGWSLRGEDEEASYDLYTQKIKVLGFQGVLEHSLNFMKEVEHDSAVGGVDQDSLAILVKHIRICETLLDEFIKRTNKKNASQEH